MTNCPVDGCQLSREHHKVLFHKDGVKSQLEIIKLEMTKFVTRKSVWVTFMSGLFLILTTGGFLLNIWADTRENTKIIPKTVEIVNQHDKQIIRIEEKILSFEAKQIIQINLLNKILQATQEKESK